MGFCSLAKAIAESVGKGQASQPFYQSMVFLVNRTYGKNENEVITRLKKLSCATQKMLDQANTIVSLVESDRERIETLSATLKLLDAVFNASSRGHVIVSDACSPKGSTELRERLFEVLQDEISANTISKNDLKASIAERPDESLEACNLMAKMANAYILLLQKDTKALQGLLDIFGDVIYRDCHSNTWEEGFKSACEALATKATDEHRSDLIAQYQKKINMCTDKIKKIRARLEEYKNAKD